MMLKQMKTYNTLVLILIAVISLSACRERDSGRGTAASPVSRAEEQISQPEAEPGTETEVGTMTAEYRKITPEEAKERIDSGEPYLLLDVRTAGEYDETHIDGAVLIPDSEIAERAAVDLPDQNATILIYCRSGRRSALAAKTLVALGYTDVYDFGGIQDWPYETISDQ